jgi:hypothetical protein
VRQNAAAFSSLKIPKSLFTCDALRVTNKDRNKRVIITVLRNRLKINHDNLLKNKNKSCREQRHKKGRPIKKPPNTLLATPSFPSFYARREEKSFTPKEE